MRTITFPVQRLLRLVRVAALAIALLAPLLSTAQPAESAATQEERIRKLEEAVRALQQQNEELRRLLTNQAPAQKPVISSPVTVTPAAAPSEVPPKKSTLWEDTDVRFFWKNGLNFQSGDGKSFKGKLGGRLQYDIAGGEEDDTIRALAGETDISSEFRRARLYTSGEIKETVHYILQIDFAGGDYKFTDAYLGLTGIPYAGTLQLGQMYEPFSLEQLTSDNYVTFPERAAPIEAFSPARNVGGLVQNSILEDRMTYSVGLFADDDNDKVDGDAFESNTRFTGRLTGLPWYDEESKGRRYFHVGAGGSIVNPEKDTVRYRARPESHLAPRYVDTGKFDADMAYIGNLEALLTLGPFSLQGEYFQTWLDSGAMGDPSFNGFYVFGSWLLTGEHRPYKKSAGIVDRVVPEHNFSFSDSGWGAWELLGRMSRVDLDDAAVKGGRLMDYTAGLGWYLNPNTRMIFNYIYSDLDRGGEEGHSHIWQTRFQVDF